jgi:uncharacterized protein (TIGR02594 family)
MGDDPMNGVDPSGAFSINFGTVGQITGSVLGDRLLAAGAGALVGFGVDKLTGGSGWTGVAIGAGAGLAATFIPPINFGSFGSALKEAAPSIGIDAANFTLSHAVQHVTSNQISLQATEVISTSLPSPVRTIAPPDLLWMLAARSQYGVTEHPSGSNGGADVEKYLRTVSLGKGYPWCAAFVNWSFIDVGINGPPHAAAALSWRNFGQHLNQPAYGSVATKKRIGGGHVGFVVGRTSSGRIVLLGGNQGDMVKYESFPASELQYNYPAGFTPNYSLPTINAGANVKMQ